MQSPLVRWCATGMIVAGTLVLSSCSESTDRKKEVFPTTGELFVGGQPAGGAVVGLHPTTGTADEWPQGFPHAVVEPDGKFAVSTYGDKDGCPTGTYKVVVNWPQAPPMGAEVDEEAETGDRLGGRYALPERSQIEVTVEAKPTTLKRIELN